MSVKFALTPRHALDSGLTAISVCVPFFKLGIQHTPKTAHLSVKHVHGRLDILDLRQSKGPIFRETHWFRGFERIGVEPATIKAHPGMEESTA